MNRRNLFKSGLTLAGGSLLASSTSAQNLVRTKRQSKALRRPLFPVVATCAQVSLAWLQAQKPGLYPYPVLQKQGICWKTSG